MTGVASVVWIFPSRSNIEAKARADADAETFDPPKWSTETYWECVKGDMMAVIYAQQHKKRTDRNERKAAGPTSTEKGHP